MNRKHLILLASAAVVLTLAGCGKNKTPSTTVTPSTETPATIAPATENPTTVTPATEAPTSVTPVSEEESIDPDAYVDSRSNYLAAINATAEAENLTASFTDYGINIIAKADGERVAYEYLEDTPSYECYAFGEDKAFIYKSTDGVNYTLHDVADFYGYYAVTTKEKAYEYERDFYINEDTLVKDLVQCPWLYDHLTYKGNGVYELNDVDLTADIHFNTATLEISEGYLVTFTGSYVKDSTTYELNSHFYDFGSTVTPDVLAECAAHVYDDDNDSTCNICGEERYFDFKGKSFQVTLDYVFSRDLTADEDPQACLHNYLAFTYTFYTNGTADETQGISYTATDWTWTQNGADLTMYSESKDETVNFRLTKDAVYFIADNAAYEDIKTAYRMEVDIGSDADLAMGLYVFDGEYSNAYASVPAGADLTSGNNVSLQLWKEGDELHAEYIENGSTFDCLAQIIGNRICIDLFNDNTYYFVFVTDGEHIYTQPVSMTYGEDIVDICSLELSIL